MSVFELLKEPLQKALRDKGIDAPTRPQELMLPAVLSGKNVLLIAPTGIGKTEAAILPLFNNLLGERKPGVRLLYVTPLRALNRDMMERLTWFGERLGIRIAVRHGDTTQAERNRQVRKPPDVLITTPETLQIMFQGRRLRKMLENVEWLVVDEIHELARDERGAQLAVAMERLLAVRGKEYQRIGLSATVGSPEEIARFLCSFRDVDILNVVEIKEFDIVVEAPEEKADDEKLQELFELEEGLTAALRHCRGVVERANSTLFFVNTRDTAELIGSRYAIWDGADGFGVHHGSLSKAVRVDMEERFKAGELKCLICTSSLELGIDVGQTDLVLQFNSPREVTRLVQRVGRAGHRVGETSRGRVVAWNPDDVMESAVTARMAMEGRLEEQPIRENPLNVLANQIISLLVEYGEANPDHAYRLVKQAYPFRNLPREDFDAVTETLANLRQIFQRDDGTITRTRRGREYFYGNISMIPDQRTYRIVDIGSRKIIGALDEGFVAGLSDGYSAFITRGTTWRVVDIQDDEVLVEQARELGALPSWVGEEIPIPFEVAMEVGRFREIGNTDEYPLNKEAARVVREYLEEQRKENIMPGPNKVTVEGDGESVIINACFGTKVNQTLGRFLSALMMAKTGEPVGMISDAYRIELKVPRRVGASDVAQLLRTSEPGSVEPLLRIHLERSTYMKWQFVHVAKKFGAISRDADMKAINIDRMMERYRDTPVFSETVNKVLFETMDTGRAAELLGRMNSGDIKVVVDRPSPMGRAGDVNLKELLSPERATGPILKALKRRLMKQKVVLGCLNCGLKRRGSVRRMAENLVCQGCGGVMLAAVHPRDEETLGLLKKGRLSPQERKKVASLTKTAELVRNRGEMALMALVARGVGPATTAKILERYPRNEEALLREILAAEVQFAKTKRFWD